MCLFKLMCVKIVSQSNSTFCLMRLIKVIVMVVVCGGCGGGDGGGVNHKLGTQF